MKNVLRQAFELETRNKYTKVNAEIAIVVEGRELPNLEVLGRSMEAAIALVQEKVTESYRLVPERV